MYHAVLDISSSHLEVLSEEIVVDVLRRSLRVQHFAPQQLPRGGVRKRKRDHKAYPSHERLVDILKEIRRHQHNAIVFLHLLEQIRGLYVRMSVVGVLDLGALAEKCVGLVKEQHAVCVFCFGKNPPMYLLTI